MKRKVLVLLVVLIAAAFYFGYLRLRAPSLKEVERAMPVQVDSAKKEQITEMKDKTKKAISAASKELKKPSENTAGR